MRLTAVALLAAGVVVCGAETPSIPRPEVEDTPRPQHVLFFLVDDLGYADVGYHGKQVNASVETPAIDALSGDGVRLESYYVTQLCSPTRTSIMSGRYPYSIGMNAEVIVDGHPSCLPVNASTIADRLKSGGWATAAYGKWDLGMTSWGCTPTCRGFDHFFGFYNAFNDYYTHNVGKYLDLRNDTEPSKDHDGEYMTELMTAEHIRWLRHQVAANPDQPTFAYFAHESNHAPMQVPRPYLERNRCPEIAADEFPVRRMLCGMMTAVDDSISNLTRAYQELGIWEKTVVIFSTDNGGNTDTGGNNYPLRGNKATTFEGGVRGVGWVGGGWPSVRRAAVSNALMHVSDWYPTIVNGIAGLPIGIPADGTPKLDGISAWDAITGRGPSNRTEILLNLNPTGKSPLVPGQGAIRVGKWKLLHGYTCVWAQQSNVYGCGSCAARDGKGLNGDPSEQPLNVTAETSPPFCPNGWVPPPEGARLPVPPPDQDGVACDGKVPCLFTNSTLVQGGTFLFDIENDPYETNDVAAQNPDIVARLLARLKQFNDTNIPQDTQPVDPASNPDKFNNIWTPWRGDSNPASCAAPPIPQPIPIGTLDAVNFKPAASSCVVSGWCSGPKYSGPSLKYRALLDGDSILNGLANISRTIAGEHGLSGSIDCANVASGQHKLEVQCLFDVTGEWFSLQHSPICVKNGKVVAC